jgi:ATP-binding cassette subfamily B protein
MIKRFMKYYKPHIGLFILDMICALLISAADLVYPMVTRNLINNIIPDKNVQLIFKIGVLLVLLYIIRMLLEFIVGYMGHVLGVRMEYDMRKEMFSHVQQLPMSFFDNTKTGHIMSRMVNDLNEISELAHHGPEDIFISTIMIIGSFVILLGVNIKLTLITFTIIPFMIYFAMHYNKKMRSNFRKTRESLADINGRLEDSLSGIRVVKSFTNEEYEMDKFDDGNSNFKVLRTQAMRYLGAFGSGVNFFSNIATTITLVAGGYFVFKGEVKMGDLVAYLIYINQFLNPVKRLANFIEQYQRGMAGFKRFTEVMDIQPDIIDKPGAVEAGNVTGDVEFKNVGFSYEEKKDVLSGINLNVRSGETVAVVGPSGAGKTTLCNLIPRFYDIDSGEILVDGCSIQNITIKSLRQNIGIVQQDVFLFSGTIRENISYGNLDASDEEIIRAATAANAHDFIMELPEGYDTYIGERGVKLSGGQRQRVSIARMFLKNPPILILDEATSSLDNESEAVIQKSIEELAKNRTTLIIAHRLATIKNAKRIIVLTEKGIEEEGTHESLMKSRGTYYRLYSTQFE